MRYLIISLLFLMTYACTMHSDRVIELARRAEWKKAVGMAGKDPSLLAAVSVVVLEQAAANDPVNARRHIRLLKNRRSENTLERLRRNPDARISGPAAAALYYMGEVDEETVKGLLESEVPQARAAALEALYSEYENFEFIQPFLADVSAFVRRVAAGALARLEPSGEVSKALSEILQRDPDPMVRSTAARTGQKLGPEAENLLFSTVKNDTNEGVRLAAVAGLAGLETDSASSRLKTLIGEGLTQVSLAAAWRLALRGDKDAQRVVIKALQNGSESVRAAAAIAAGQIRGALTPDLIDALKDDSASVVLQAAAALVRTGALENEEHRKSISHALRELASGRDSVESAQAAEILVKTDRESAEAVLDELVLHEEPVIRAAVGSSAARAELWNTAAAGLSDPDPAVRTATASAVVNSGYEE